MTLRVSASLGRRLTTAISDALVIPGLPSASNASWFDACRSSAFEEVHCPDRFAWEYLRYSVFSKFDDGSKDSARVKRARAFEDLLVSESECANTNNRLVEWWSRAHLDQRTWLRARSLCERILGQFSSSEEFPWSCGFGPGASTGLPRSRASLQNKWALAAHITEPALPYMSAFISWAGMPQLHRFCRIVPGNKVTTVPKNWKKDRLIAIEPDWNMFFQKGIGKMIRRRLQAFGQLHDNAQSVNSGLARLGSATGLLATLDLSRASDSISLALCEALLPSSWFKVICDLRSERGVFDGVELAPYEKISSMGNGFTFELETLLIYVLVCASCSKESWDRIFVYGDDIICPTSEVGSVFSTLLDAGFTINPEKSFHTGPFRESCGGHWFEGRDVTPFYIKQVPRHIGDLCVLGNAMTAFTHNRPLSDYTVLSDPYRLLKRSVPRKFRGPLGMDGVLWSNWDASCPRWVSHEQRYAQPSFVKVPIGYKNIPYRSGALLASLWNGPIEDSDARMSRLARHDYTYRSTPIAVDREAWSLFTEIG